MTAGRMDRAWRDFQAWCRGKGLPALPANPWTVAAYLRYRDKNGGGPAVAEALRAIGRAHILRSVRPPHNHPMVLRTVKRLAERDYTAPAQSALFDDSVVVDKKPSPEPEETPDDTLAEEPVAKEDEHIDETDDESPEPQSQSARLNRSMRVTPKLVSRRPRRPTTEAEPE